MTLKAYRLSWSGEYCALAYAESHTKARAMGVGYYTGSKEDEPYIGMRAVRLKHMDGHPLTPTEPCILDSFEHRELVDFSFVHRCKNCGARWVDDYFPCDCDGGSEAFDRECREAYSGIDFDSQRKVRRKRK